MKDPIAILCSDLHLSLTPPACRAEDDWLDVQATYLNWLKDYAKTLPVICAGDIFDRWNPPPELIHFALEYLPDEMICVPGQHDLPNHRIADMHRSGYGVLKRANKIRDLSGAKVIMEHNLAVHGFGWDEELEPCDGDDNRFVELAVIHRYVWATAENAYPGAPADAQLAYLAPKLTGYHAAVFGDNHKGFYRRLKTGTEVLNCGTFFRRKSDEIDYKPQIGVLLSDGGIVPKPIPDIGDKFHANSKEREAIAVNMQEFIESLEDLGEHGLNFREAVENLLDVSGSDAPTKEIVLRALDAKAKD